MGLQNAIKKRKLNNEIKATANPQQLQAIKTINGPLLIIAGPGTGKTFTLINRTLNLIVNHNIDPSSIFLATFTEKASKELTSRLSSMLAKYEMDFNPNDMYVGTFHSICLKILKENVEKSRLEKNFKVVDQFEQQYFIYNHLSDFIKIKNFDLFISANVWWDKAAELMKVINRLQEELVNYDELLKSNIISDNFYGEILKIYEDLRIKNNLLDFSSIQVETYKMLIEHEELKEKLLNKIKYIMVDEYQDTNHIQEKLSLLLSSKQNNICVVGDDDQAIYRFRGATVRNILEFQNHFNFCQKVELVNNYRSNSRIVDFYNDWMDVTEGRDFKFEWDKYRYDKKIVAAKNSEFMHDAVIQLSTKEPDYLNQKVLEFIKNLQKSGKISNLNQIAFLFRSVKNEDVIQLANYLESNNIPVYSPRSNMFFKRLEVKAIVGCLYLLFPNFVRDIETSEHKFALHKFLKECELEAIKILKNPKYSDFQKWYKRTLNDIKILDVALDYAFTGIIFQMLSFEPFSDMVKTDLNSGVYDTRTARNVALLESLIARFEKMYNISVLTKNNVYGYVKKLFNTYFRFLLEGGITEYEDESEYAPSNCVSFMTIHQSKGMEFPIVVVGSQSATPRKQYDENVENIVKEFSGRGQFEDIESTKYFDFWRLYYVAFSRAQSLLVMLCDASKNNEPSKYFERLYKELPYDVELDKFDFEKVKPTNIKNAYSFTSDINVYLTCPTQYMFFKELGFEPVRSGGTLFGTVVHQTIEDINKKIISKEANEITEEKIKEWLDINYETASKANNSYLGEKFLKAGLEQVLNYYKRVKDNPDLVSQSELPITLVNGDYIISGKVDLVVNNKGKYQLLDFKTEKKPNLVKDADKINRVKRQLEIYTYLFEKRYGIKVDGMRVYYTSELNSNPFINFKKEDENIKKTIKEFDNVVKNIENKNFESRCSDLNICKNCDFRFYCRRT